MLLTKEKKLLIITGVLVLFGIGITIYIPDGGSEVKIEKDISNADSSSEKMEENKTPKEKILVHVGGAVNSPGVYKCKKNSRLYKLVKKAEGPTNQADLNAVNLARQIKDGEKIVIPAKKTISEKIKTSTRFNTADNKNNSSKININSAAKTELKKLSGIGPTLADRIIEYRQKNSSFKNLKELTKVSGIGKKTLAEIKGKITY